MLEGRFSGGERRNEQIEAEHVEVVVNAFPAGLDEADFKSEELHQAVQTMHPLASWIATHHSGCG